MVRRTVLVVSSVVKVVTKPLLTLALLRFIFSVPVNMLV
jgi:hypothetical protein